MSRQAGIALAELLTVVALGTLMLVVSVVYSVPWMAKEALRGATHDVRAFMQLTRTEAVTRNRPCRLVVHTDTGALQIFDSLGTSSTGDDRLLHTGSVPQQILFSRPDSGSALTIKQIASSPAYETVFTGEGIVGDGVGDVFLHGGESFGRVSVYAAGGLEVRFWNGNTWRGDT